MGKMTQVMLSTHRKTASVLQFPSLELLGFMHCCNYSWTAQKMLSPEPLFGTKCHLVAGLCPDSLQDLKCSPWLRGRGENKGRGKDVHQFLKVGPYVLENCKCSPWKSLKLVFTVRHALQSLRLSVKCVDCDKTEESSSQIFIPHEREFTLVL